MHYGSSEEEKTIEDSGSGPEDGAQDRSQDGAQDRPQDGAQGEIDLRGAGLVPAPPLFSFQNNRLPDPSGAPSGRCRREFSPRPRLVLSFRSDDAALRSRAQTLLAFRAMRARTMRARDLPRRRSRANAPASVRRTKRRAGAWDRLKPLCARGQVIRFWRVLAHSPSATTAWNPSRSIIFHSSDTAAASLASSVERSTT